MASPVLYGVLLEDMVPVLGVQCVALPDRSPEALTRGLRRLLAPLYEEPVHGWLVAQLVGFKNPIWHPEVPAPTLHVQHIVKPLMKRGRATFRNYEWYYCWCFALDDAVCKAASHGCKERTVRLSDPETFVLH